MFGAAFLIVTCLVSVFFLKKRIKYLEDTIWGMQIESRKKEKFKEE